MTLLAVYWFTAQKSTVNENKIIHDSITKHLKYRFTITNTSHQTLTNPKFWAFAPVKNTSTQSVISLTASEDYELLSDDLSNQVLAFTWKHWPPYATKVITVQAKIKLFNKPQPEVLNPIQEKVYLQSTQWINKADSNLVAIAEQVKHENLSQSASNAFQWTASNINYSGYQSKQKSASDTLRTGKGDCTEYMHLVTALNRINDIPTREVAGFVMEQDRLLKADEYHNWAEAYVDGKWELSDPQNKKHQQDYKNYIAFRHYGDEKNKPLLASHRFKTNTPQLNVVMN